MNLVSPRNLYPLLFLPLSGDVSENHNDPKPKVAITLSDECSDQSVDEAIQRFRQRSRDGATIQVMIPAGPNRTRNQEPAVKLANSLSNIGYPVSLEAKVDIGLGETSDQDDVAGIHLALDEEVDFQTTEQATGTSYTEAAFSTAGTGSSDLVLVAHNRFYQWRLGMAARNVVEMDGYGENLQSVYVVCHDSNPLPENLGKEALSFLLDAGTDLVGGHDLVMETSKGGMRLAKLKAYLRELIY